MSLKSFFSLDNLDNTKIVQLVFIIFILSLGLRLWGLDQKLFTMDKKVLNSDEQLIIRDLQADNLIEQLRTAEVSPPLFYLLAQAVTNFTGKLEIYPIQLLSVVFGSLTGLVVFFLTRELLGVKTALVAMFFFAFFPSNIFYSQFARKYALLILLSTASTYFFVRWLKQGKGLALLTMTNILLMYVHYMSFAIIIMQLVVAVLSRKNFPVKLLSLAKSFIVVVIVTLPLLLLIPSQLDVHRNFEPQMSSGDFDKSIGQAITGWYFPFLNHAVHLPTGLWFCSPRADLCFEDDTPLPVLMFFVIALMILFYTVKGFLKLSKENKTILGLSYFGVMFFVLVITATPVLTLSYRLFIMVSPLLVILLANSFDHSISRKKLLVIFGWLIILFLYYFELQKNGIGLGAPVI